jgi:hypothetical protein
MVDSQIPILKEWDWTEDLFLFVIVIFIVVIDTKVIAISL